MEISQSKLSVYEENPSFSKFKNDFADYDNINGGIEELQEKINDLEKLVKDLENENSILKINNSSELNTRLLKLE